MVTQPSEKHLFRRRVKQQNERTVMGDKSPKSTQKKTAQKASKKKAAGKKK